MIIKSGFIVRSSQFIRTIAERCARSRDVNGPLCMTTCQVAKLASELAALSRPNDVARGKARFATRQRQNNHDFRAMKRTSDVLQTSPDPDDRKTTVS